MKKYITITEEKIHSIVDNILKRIVKEGAWDKYQDDLMDIEMDNVQDDMGMARAYSQMNDPMIKYVKGSTVRDMLSPDMGNKLDSEEGNYEDYSQDFITNDWLNTPNASKNYDKFPRI